VDDSSAVRFSVSTVASCEHAWELNSEMAMTVLTRWRRGSRASDSVIAVFSAASAAFREQVFSAGLTDGCPRGRPAADQELNEGLPAASPAD
jgi:hypothetical protein